MTNPSPGIRLALWLNETEGCDLNHASRLRVSKKVRQMIHSEVMKERRRCALICEVHAHCADAYKADAIKVAATTIRAIRSKIIAGEAP